jgi:hypothetical protein
VGYNFLDSQCQSLYKNIFQNKNIFRPTYPIFLALLPETQHFFLGLITSPSSTAYNTLIQALTLKWTFQIKLWTVFLLTLTVVHGEQYSTTILLVFYIQQFMLGKSSLIEFTQRRLNSYCTYRLVPATAVSYAKLRLLRIHQLSTR